MVYTHGIKTSRLDDVRKENKIMFGKYLVNWNEFVLGLFLLGAMNWLVVVVR
jgi:hypothetical protein